MEHLSEELIIEILKRITRTSDLNSLSLVSKQFYNIDAEQRATIRIGCGLPTEDISALCSRFTNLLKVEIDYSGSTPGNGNRIDNKRLFVLSSRCTLLNDITLSFCSKINNAGIACLIYCKKLTSLKLNSIPEVTSRGLLLVAFGCRVLSSLYLNDCKRIAGSTEWLEYLGSDGSLEELVVNNCKGISQYDFLKFGQGWMKLKKFEFGNKERMLTACCVYKYDLCCENLEDLRLARLLTEPEGPEIGLRFLLRKCRALEKLCLEYVDGLIDKDMIVLSKSCKNLKGISLRMIPRHYHEPDGLTDESLEALANNCPLLQDVELAFTGVEHWKPPEIGFTQEGLVKLMHSCPIRALTLNGALFFNDKGMKGLSSAPFLETLSLVDCKEITDSGMCFLVHYPCLTDLKLQYCPGLTDFGMAELVHAQKLQSLVVDGCCNISENAVHGAARSVQYFVNSAGSALLYFSMERLSEELIIEILKRITRTSDLNSLSLVSKQLYAIDAEQRATICICGLSAEDFSALCSRFPNLLKVEIDYSGSTPGNGNRIDNQGLFVLSSSCNLLNDLTLSFCSKINDAGIACITYFKKLMSLKLNSIPEVTSSGLLLVAFGCKALSSLYLNDCKGIAGSTEWLEYLGSDGSLEELVVNNCQGISQYDFLKFGRGWMKLKKFEFVNKESMLNHFMTSHDPSYSAKCLYKYDLCCENLEDLRLARLRTEPEGTEIGLRFLLRKCKALEKLCLEYVGGLVDKDMIVLSQSCKNLKSISLWMIPRCYHEHEVFRMGFTDESLEVLAHNCPLLQDVELTFTGDEDLESPEISFTQEGLVKLMHSCPIRSLTLNGTLFFNDKGMKGLSSAPFLETLRLVDCKKITDYGMCFVVHYPCLTDLKLQYCPGLTDVGIAELGKSSPEPDTTASDSSKNRSSGGAFLYIRRIHPPPPPRSPPPRRQRRPPSSWFLFKKQSRPPVADFFEGSGQLLHLEIPN
uniref:F-box domain-containing protein n=1 Tax=Oryza punctata TaxID=4537 RepID=A0A0E0KPG7_ORYPU